MKALVKYLKISNACTYIFQWNKLWISWFYCFQIWFTWGVWKPTINDIIIKF